MNDMTFCTLPYDLKMVDRVTEIDYNGGVYEIGVREVAEDEDSICVYLDAAIFNDDVQIMQIDSYSMRITNADK